MVSSLPPQEMLEREIEEAEGPPMVEREPPKAWLLLAEEARRQGRYQKATEFLKRYLEKKRDPYVMNNLGALYLLLHEDQKAYLILKEALELKEDPEIAYNLALSLLAQGKIKEACQVIGPYPELKEWSQRVGCPNEERPK
jgi:tetratricopeptide (TPR) repeat protein